LAAPVGIAQLREAALPSRSRNAAAVPNRRTTRTSRFRAVSRAARRARTSANPSRANTRSTLASDRLNLRHSA
jgi:hypothetical protein